MSDRTDDIKFGTQPIVKQLTGIHEALAQIASVGERIAASLELIAMMRDENRVWFPQRSENLLDKLIIND